MKAGSCRAGSPCSPAAAASTPSSLAHRPRARGRVSRGHRRLAALPPAAADPGARSPRRALASLRRTTAAIGPTVAPSDARRSFARARACLRLQAAGTLTGSGLIVAGEQLAALILHNDETLLGELADRRLAPLAELTPGAAERLHATLREWLRWQGSVPDVAAALHVHPQTVRYRLTRLRELFGAALEDPESRFELMLATRARVSEPVA